MFRFVALFALVAVATAEPQAQDATQKKTTSGDTASVATHKEHQLKVYEYGKKGYPFRYANPAGYTTPVVTTYASPLVTYANTYATGMPVYHPLGKREAEADSQYFYNAGDNANGYKRYFIPNVFNNVASPAVYNNVYNGGFNGLYNTYAGVHSIGKREADADSQYIYTAGVYANGYNGYALPKVFNRVYNTVVSPDVSYNGVNNGLYNTYAGIHAIGKREAEADSQWIYNNAYKPVTGYTGYNRLTGYTTPYTYGNVWNNAQYLW